MKGAIIDLSQEAPPTSLSVEILIIGSGSGGATAARVLSEAGHEVEARLELNGSGDNLLVPGGYIDVNAGYRS